MVYQGEYMDISLSGFQIPIASLSLLDTIGVLVLIPIMDKLVYPLLKKCNVKLSQLQRIGVGMIIVTLSMACAGGIELYRKEQCCMNQKRGSNGTETKVSNITIFYQVPQYTLIGLSEVFTSITGKFLEIFFLLFACKRSERGRKEWLAWRLSELSKLVQGIHLIIRLFLSAYEQLIKLSYIASNDSFYKLISKVSLYTNRGKKENKKKKKKNEIVWTTDARMYEQENLFWMRNEHSSSSILRKTISEPKKGIEPATFWWPVRRSNHLY